MKGEALAEAPMPIHQRQADRGVGVEHLLGGDDLDLNRIDIEAEFVERDPLDRVVGLAQRREIPVGTGEERGTRPRAAPRPLSVCQARTPPFANSSWNTEKICDGSPTRRIAKCGCAGATSL